MQEPISKDLKELKNKHTETTQLQHKTTQLLKLKILQKESIAEYLKQKNESDKMVEITSKEQNKVKRMKKAEDSLRDLWGHIK